MFIAGARSLTRALPSGSARILQSSCFSTTSIAAAASSRNALVAVSSQLPATTTERISTQSTLQLVRRTNGVQWLGLELLLSSLLADDGG
eukprot:TRINITY_DN11877_c0_g1_i1.p2 TRINITY_DN11877_c0_g1~~TRINITY_DN11877_c0_g1_i1.p2  ORF type:complete len:103 (-),score=1.58 TRINITY_DN11877_c0_g1_i1:316-585(-)